MYNIESLSKYIPIVDFIADACGPACEVVLYDVSSPTSSIVAVKNDVSGKKSGGPMSDIVRKLIDTRTYIERDYVINYKGYTEDNRLCSVFFLKEQDKLLGMLCLFKDVQLASDLLSTIFALLDRNNMRMQETQESYVEATEGNAVINLLKTMVEKEINETGVHPARLTLNEKVRLVHRLSEKGVLMIDGAISEIANQLLISEPTVYRYLNRAI